VTYRPLVVDLDGSLLKSDLLLESGFAYIKDAPFHFYMPIFWLLKGKANLKEKLANSVNINVTLLPYNEDVLQLIHNKKQQGCRIILATASHITLAAKVAEHLGVFDEVFATTQQSNLSASRKKDFLIEQYGDRGYDYIGNSMDDLSVWESAN